MEKGGAQHGNPIFLAQLLRCVQCVISTLHISQRTQIKCPQGFAWEVRSHPNEDAGTETQSVTTKGHEESEY